MMSDISSTSSSKKKTLKLVYYYVKKYIEIWRLMRKVRSKYKERLKANNSHGNAKHVWRTNLLSFQQRAPDRFIDTSKRQRLVGSSLRSKRQHACLLTENKLHEVVKVIGRSLQFKQYTVDAFLKIEGVFNNLTIKSGSRRCCATTGCWPYWI